MTATSELTTDQVAEYLEATCALIESELTALGDDSGWHGAAGLSRSAGAPGTRPQRTK